MLQYHEPPNASGETDGEKSGNSRKSGHGRVTDALRRRIRNGDWAPGCAIPSRRHLATEYNVSPATIERAMVPLLTDGTLRADDRRGTFVAESTVLTRSSAFDPVPILRSALKQAPIAENGYHYGPVAIVAPLYAPECKEIGQSDHWVREIVGALETELAEHGRHTTFVNRVPGRAVEPVALRESLEQALSDRSLSGLAFISFDLDSKQIEEAYDVLAHFRDPVVSIVAEPLSLPVPHIVLDDHRAGFQAAQYMITRGHDALTVLIPERANWAEARFEGVRAAADRAGLAAAKIRVLRGDNLIWSHDGDPMAMAAVAINQAFENGWEPYGPIICATDMAALVLMGMLSERGYEVGSEIPVLGFDDHQLSRDAGLTTMRPPMRAMGAEAARLLLAGTEGRSNGCQLRLCSKLIPRRSTATILGPHHDQAANETPAAAAEAGVLQG